MDRRSKISMVNGIAALGIAGTYVLFAPAVAQPLYNKLLFFPDFPVRYEEKSYQLTHIGGIAKTEISMPATANINLDAWYFHNPASKKLVIVSHGNAGNVSSRVGLAEYLLSAGVSVLLYDYQGYGKSGGVASIRNICADGIAAFDYARDQLGFKPEDIILYGESLGCAVACHAASERSCGALILQSGFSSLKAIASQAYWIFNIYPSFCFPRPPLDNLSFLQGKHPPVLIVHGQNDQTIPVSHSELMFRAASEPKQLVILPSSNHGVEPADNELFRQHLAAFLSSR